MDFHATGRGRSSLIGATRTPRRPPPAHPRTWCALRFPRGGIGLVIGASAIVFTGYHLSFVVGESLADRQVISPFVAMWMANAFLLAVVLLLVWRPGGQSGAHGAGSIVMKMIGVERIGVRRRCCLFLPICTSQTNDLPDRLSEYQRLERRLMSVILIALRGSGTPTRGACSISCSRSISARQDSMLRPPLTRTHGYLTGQAKTRANPGFTHLF